MHFRKIKNNKLVAGIAFLLIFALAGSYLLFFNSKKASAAWWNDSWQYRKSIAVTNSSGGE